MLNKPAANATPLPDADGPSFSADYAVRPLTIPAKLRVISWNIRLGKLIEPAISELAGEPALANADIVLLQEMSETATDAISRALGYNYIYYPACVHSDTGEYFGNAILSRWPIGEIRKVPLPHLSPRTKEKRIAACGQIEFGADPLLVYSVHTETFHLDLARRQEQFEALAADVAGQHHDRILLGGDFNTLRPRDIRMLTRVLASVGMRRASASAGPTASLGFMGLRLDHIFTRGMEIRAAGSTGHTHASDHFPLWVKLTLTSDTPAAVKS